MNWVDYLRKPKIELLERKREIFEAFKLECGIQLYIVFKLGA